MRVGNAINVRVNGKFEPALPDGSRVYFGGEDVYIEIARNEYGELVIRGTDVLKITPQAANCILVEVQ